MVEQSFESCKHALEIDGKKEIDNSVRRHYDCINEEIIKLNIYPKITRFINNNRRETSSLYTAWVEEWVEENPSTTDKYNLELMFVTRLTRLAMCP